MNVALAFLRNQSGIPSFYISFVWTSQQTFLAMPHYSSIGLAFFSAIEVHTSNHVKDFEILAPLASNSSELVAACPDFTSPEGEIGLKMRQR